MKKILLPFVAFLIGATGVKGEVTVAEPEFNRSFHLLTSDSTYVMMPKETATFKKHESKMSRWAKIGGAVADAAGTVGMGVALSSNNIGTVIGGIRAANQAAGVATVANSLETLSAGVGMDLVFDGKQSPCIVKEGDHVRFVLKMETNDTDPMEFMRVVRFKQGKKDRKIQWLNVVPAVLGTDDANKKGYLAFQPEKYGETSYLITIFGEYLTKGEYGIVMGSETESTVIPIATFSVQ